MGGFDREGFYGFTLMVHIFNYDQMTWNLLNTLPTRIARSRAVLFDGLIYLVGGVKEDWSRNDKIISLPPASGFSWAENATLHRGDTDLERPIVVPYLA